MTAIANFGEWVRMNWLVFGALFGSILGAVIALNSPKSVSLDAKHWECTLAVPDGISTRCTEYHYRGR